MRLNLFVIFLSLTLLISSCKDNVICPAFQSTYILNDSIRYAKFSLFGPDSLPKYAVASRRNKFGINKQTSLFRKNYELKTSPKINVLGPPAKDSLFVLEEGEFIASDFVETDSLLVDSLATDSLSVPEVVAVEPEPTGPKYKYRYNPGFPYNHEQEYYNKYYGELLVDNRPPEPEPDPLSELSAEEDTLATNKPRKRGLKGLFKRKGLEEEGAAEAPEEVDEFLGEEPEEEEEEGEGGN